MFFSNLARLLAITCFIVGLLQIAIGFLIATGVVGPYETALARYTSSSSSGQAIDNGIYVAIVAIALGTLAEISFSVRKQLT